MKGKVLVAMSGGVDSSVAAGLLVRRGYQVIGVTMQIWQESQTDPRHAGCCSLGAVEDARRVARILGIPHYVLNFKEAFRKTVIEDFIDEYSAGRTPNPCIRCNKHVKFDVLLSKLPNFGCSALATGHYARIRKSRATGEPRLLRARGREKDQSYVLYMLTGEQLAKCMFPLGEFTAKAQIRELAVQLRLPVAHKPDSQEICFVSEAGGYAEFLRKARPETFRPGDMIDAEGHVVGRHAGLPSYTVGQRRGLGISDRSGRPLYVLGLDARANSVRVGPAEGLMRREVPLRNVVWHESADRTMRVHAKVRYNMHPQPALLLNVSNPTLVFDEPVRAAAPGQTAVAYRGQTVIAGGTIGQWD